MICDQEGELVLPKYALRVVRLTLQTKHQSDTLAQDHPDSQKSRFLSIEFPYSSVITHF